MRTRAIKDNNIVWFGSYGKNLDGTAKFYDENKIFKDTKEFWDRRGEAARIGKNVVVHPESIWLNVLAVNNT